MLEGKETQGHEAITLGTNEQNYPENIQNDSNNATRDPILHLLYINLTPEPDVLPPPPEITTPKENTTNTAYSHSFNNPYMGTEEEPIYENIDPRLYQSSMEHTYTIFNHNDHPSHQQNQTNSAVQEDITNQESIYYLYDDDQSLQLYHPNDLGSELPEEVDPPDQSARVPSQEDGNSLIQLRTKDGKYIELDLELQNKFLEVYSKPKSEFGKEYKNILEQYNLSKNQARHAINWLEENKGLKKKLNRKTKFMPPDHISSPENTSSFIQLRTKDGKYIELDLELQNKFLEVYSKPRLKGEFHNAHQDLLGQYGISRKQAEHAVNWLEENKGLNKKVNQKTNFMPKLLFKMQTSAREELENKLIGIYNLPVKRKYEEGTFKMEFDKLVKDSGLKKSELVIVVNHLAKKGKLQLKRKRTRVKK